MPAKYVDTHCHLASDRFAGDAGDVIAACLEAGIAMLAVACDAAGSEASLRLAEAHGGVLASVGVHPNDVLRHDEGLWAAVRRLAARPKCAAIGETGLDYYRRDVMPDVQKRWFARHIELALEADKTLVVHARDSAPDVLAMLGPYFPQGLKAIWHCFTARRREIGAAFDFAVKNGLHLAVGGLVTYRDQKCLREYAAMIPDELLLLETDAPYLVPAPKTAARNDPRGVVRVAEALAELRRTEPDRIAETTAANASRLLGFH